MQITNTQFVKSSPSHKECPDDGKPEFAFIGRSNVGKSSLTNAILGEDRVIVSDIAGTKQQTENCEYFK